MLEITCPNCGASMEIADDREFAYCSFCGTKIITKTNIELNHTKEINNLLNRAFEFEEKKDYLRARDYCNRVLDIDSSNEIARSLEERLNEYAPINNVVIKYITSFSSKHKLLVTTDGKNWITIDPNNQASLRLTLGTHKIFFSGTKNYSRNITVSDTKKIIEIIYTGALINNIQIKYN